jgi:hypothetical protein
MTALILLNYLCSRGISLKNRGEASEMGRLFSVYKIENGTRVLLGGLVERRKSRRRGSNKQGLVEFAKRKFAESPDEDIKIVLREEK